MNDVSESQRARYREIALILAEEGLGALAVSMKLPEAVRAHHGTTNDATGPERVRKALERLGPTGVKFGQMLSTRVDLVPEAYRVELQRLQDDVAPISYEEVAEVIAAELGAPTDILFARFSREPLASASIGQVHAATLWTGREVVVKVQRPGILNRVEVDLDLVTAQAHRIESSGMGPAGIDIAGTAEQFAQAVRAELDYLTEAESIEKFRAAFADSSEVVIPRVFHDYTTRRVITLERLDGVPFSRPERFDEFGFDRHELAMRGVRAYLKQLFELGTFHADPHPGNIFALPDGRIGFTDFGRVGRVSPGVRDAAADILLAMVDQDADLAADALIEISTDPGKIDFEQLRRELVLLIGKYHGAELGELRAGEMIVDLLDLVRREELCLPSEFSLMMATLAVLESVGSDLDPDFDFIEVARPYSERLMREQFKPRNLTSTMFRSLRRIFRAGAQIPSSAERALRRIGEGEFRVAVRPEGFQTLLDRAEELVDRLAFAVLIASFVIGFSFLLSVEWLPQWIQIALLLGMLAAIGVSAWMFASLLLARLRGRRGAR